MKIIFFGQASFLQWLQLTDSSCNIAIYVVYCKTNIENVLSASRKKVKIIEKYVYNMSQVNNKNTRTTSMTSFLCFLFTLKIFYTFL